MSVDEASSRRRRRAAIGLLGIWVLLLAASGIVRGARGESPVGLELRTAPVAAVEGERRTGTMLRLAWQEWESEGADGVPVVLLHGSPGSHRDFRNLGPLLADERRVLAPDLPGFGASGRDAPDYSVRAHAHYIVDLLERLAVPSAHILGFSMGGGVALEMVEIAPDRVASVTLVASIGVQEMELLGSYTLNHMIHGLQLGALWLLEEAVPHFGLFDDLFLGVTYARNFYDTDQRPLRQRLLELEVPLYIIHGERDPLVPAEAAIEHHRLVPHSELDMLADSHFFVFGPRPDLPGRLQVFFEKVDSRRAAVRSTASADRVARSLEPYDPADAPRWMGPALLVVVLLLALATFVSEDLTCIGAGLLVAQGRIGLVAAIVACFLGIFVGDLLLYAAGRFLGRPVLRLPPLRWWVSERAVERSGRWFERRGGVVIALGRFVPGTRLPTYLAAGILRVPIVRCAFHFFLAAAVWTPLLVGAAVLGGGAAMGRVEGFQRQSLWLFVVMVAVLWTMRGVVLPLLTWRGRRRALGFWRRWTRWEYWPAWLLYPPLLAYLVFLGLRHRGLTVFTACNPVMPAGGLLGESKMEILGGLGKAGDAVPVWRELVGGTAAQKASALRSFLDDEELSYPVIVKPDIGQRGSEVALVQSEAQALAHLESHPGRFMAQEFVDGPELSAFYYRYPGEEAGRLFSITEKERPVLEGDGQSTVEDLVLADERAVVLWRVYRDELGERFSETPGAGERVELVEIGAHARGTIFRDGWSRFTPELEAAVDDISRSYDGFFFGRFDLRAASWDDFAQGRGLRVLELNGVSSDSTDIYDPENGYFEAYRKLLHQWRLAYEIGSQNRGRGARVWSLRELVALLFEHRRYLP